MSQYDKLLSPVRPFEIGLFGKYGGKGSRELKLHIIKYQEMVTRLREWMPRNQKEKDRFYETLKGQRRVISNFKLRIKSFEKRILEKNELIKGVRKASKAKQVRIVKLKNRPVRIKSVVKKVRVRSGHTRGSALAMISSTSLSYTSLSNALYQVELMKYAFKTEISPISMSIMLYVSNYKYLSQREIAKSFDFEDSTITRHMRPLYKNELLAYDRIKHEKRAYLTIKGTEVMAKFNKNIRAVLRERHEQNKPSTN